MSFDSSHCYPLRLDIALPKSLIQQIPASIAFSVTKITTGSVTQPAGQAQEAVDDGYREGLTKGSRGSFPPSVIIQALPAYQPLFKSRDPVYRQTHHISYS